MTDEQKLQKAAGLFRFLSNRIDADETGEGPMSLAEAREHVTSMREELRDLRRTQES